MPDDQTQKLAERIASILQEGENDRGDFASLRSSIEKINQRLERIESHSVFQDPLAVIRSAQTPHASQERFAVIEAVGDEIFENFKNEKACTFEPNGKPCDHCAMCSSRGF
jgi:hypothetical protein